MKRKLFRRKDKTALPMQPSNVLIISSSAKDLWEVVEMSKSKYIQNSDPIRLDNGDFAIVIRRNSK